MRLECFPLVSHPPELVPGRPDRDWMDQFKDRHPYRCLPMTMANTTGWELLCPMGFTAEWNGGKRMQDITFIPDRPHPDFHAFALSHFSEGVVSFQVGYLFRTPPGWSILCEGPPNLIKHGIQPLVGIVESDWLPFPFSMNWRFTAPGRVRFEKGEPFCFIVPVEDKKVEAFDIVYRSLDADPDLQRQYEAWKQTRTQFNVRVMRGDPTAQKAAWQRFYFRGELPEEEPSERPADHVHKRRLKAPHRDV
jgi:hypothetical protein